MAANTSAQGLARDGAVRGRRRDARGPTTTADHYRAHGKAVTTFRSDHQWSMQGGLPTGLKRTRLLDRNRVRRHFNKMIKALASSESTEWYTPRVYIERVRRVI